MPMLYNYHTHTYRCGHADGAVEDYIKRAIDCGVTDLGFSDHMPFVCSDGFESTFRVPTAQVTDYVREIAELREKYKEQIRILIGFETEYYPRKFDEMFRNALDYGAEYLIMGEHFMDEEHPDQMHTIAPTTDAERLERYVACVAEGIRRRVFTQIAHPDMFHFVGDADLYHAKMREICLASKECAVPLEINLLGIRGERNYPNDAFWKVAGEVGCPVTFGCDAHTPMDVYDDKSAKKAMAIVEKYHLQYIGKPKPVLIQTLR